MFDYIPLKSLPSLPAGLKILHCNHTHLTTLPELPATLKVLDYYNTPLLTLPSLPPTLYSLHCNHTPIPLPPLPRSLGVLWYYDSTGTLDKLYGTRSIQLYYKELQKEERVVMKRIQAKSQLLKEEIAMAVWHPRKVARLLEFGVELEDM